MVETLFDPTNRDSHVVDIKGTYSQWFTAHHCAAVLVRPDFYIFGTAASLQDVPSLVTDLRVHLAGGSDEI